MAVIGGAPNSSPLSPIERQASRSCAGTCVPDLSPGFGANLSEYTRKSRSTCFRPSKAARAGLPNCSSMAWRTTRNAASCSSLVFTNLPCVQIVYFPDDRGCKLCYFQAHGRAIFHSLDGTHLAKQELRLVAT